VTDAITIQNPRNRGGSTGHVLAKRSVTFTEIRTIELTSILDWIIRQLSIETQGSITPKEIASIMTSLLDVKQGQTRMALT